MTRPPHPPQPRPPDAISVALGLLRAGRAAEAAALFRQVLEQAPRSRDAMNGLGLALAAQGAPADGLPWLERAIGDGGVPASWHANHGSLLRQLGRDADAVEAFRAAIARDAESPRP